jgi:hypothetical protein
MTGKIVETIFDLTEDFSQELQAREIYEELLDETGCLKSS